MPSFGIADQVVNRGIHRIESGEFSIGIRSDEGQPQNGRSRSQRDLTGPDEHGIILPARNKLHRRIGLANVRLKAERERSRLFLRRRSNKA
jgi:hypothetical protein